ncbi:MAG: hypothetical protein IJK63_09725 [Oscillospiraceae bacterium]|nr:hypothetical protein [Oscillospiraceae bacterium]
MWNQAAITNAGREVLASAAAGNLLTIDNAASGSGTVEADALKSCTDVSSRKKTLTVTGVRSSGAGITVEVMLTAAETAYQARQIGVFGHTGTGAAVLLAIFQDADGIAIPSTGDMPDFAYVFYATIQVGNVSSITATVDPSALVTQSQLQNAVSTAVQQLSTRELTLTLDKDDWEADGDFYTQTVSCEGMTANSKAAAGPAADSWIAAQEANLFPPVPGAGALSFKSEYRPSADIDVIVHIYG